MENARYIPPAEKHVQFKSGTIAKIDASNHLLKSTFATQNGKYVKPEYRPKPDDYVEEVSQVPSKPDMVGFIK